MDGRDEEDWLVLARIRRPWGVRGEVALEIHTDWPGERFRPGSELLVRWDDGRTETLRLERYRPTNDGAVAAFAGIGSIPEARVLSGGWIEARRSELPEPTDGYRRADLIGMKIVGLDGQQLGEVLEVEESIASDLLVVALVSGNEALIPLAPAICTEINLETGQITVDPPEGLLELGNALSADSEAGS